jgi:hypothetical protein
LRAAFSAGVLFLAGVFAGLVVMTVEPNLWVKVGEAISDDPGEVEAEELVFSPEQIEDLNKVYEEREDEYGYCFGPRENSSIDLRHPTSVNRSNSSFIRYSGPLSFSGRLHTHPGADSIAELSTEDKTTLVNSTIDFSCVLAGPVPDDVESGPASLQCYRDPFPDREFESEEELNEAVQDVEFLNVPVRVQ